MRALLIINIQNDYLSGGSVSLANGDRIVPVINQLIDNFNVVLAAKDWHPENSKHFEVWPKHCIKNTPGADFPPELKKDKIDVILKKGTTGKDYGYSAFSATNEDLDSLLRENGVDELYIAGFRTEFSVKETAIGAAERNYKTYVIRDAVVAGLRDHYTRNQAIMEMLRAGVDFIEMKDIDK